MKTSRSSTAPQTRLADFLQRAGDVGRYVERAVWPPVDLLIRVWLAQAFLVSGILKVGNWDNALLLAREEYPVPWMDAVTAAYTGVAIELIAPVFLLLGLATRVAALPLLALTLVIQHWYIALDVHLFWAALFGWYVVHGAGALSLDRMLSRGLARSPIPFGAALARATDWIGATIAPLYDLALRLWIGAGLFLVAAVGSVPAGEWLALRTSAAIDAPLALICAALLAFGIATRAGAIALLFVALAAPMRGVPIEHLSWFALLLVPLILRGGGPLSIDRVLLGRLHRWVPGFAEPDPTTLQSLPRVVVVGAGFGGIACTRALRHAPVSVTLIDRHNYHLFQPLLYQVATAGLAPSDIAMPVREVFREQRNARVLLGEVRGVDTVKREVLVEGKHVPYDFLVLATGAGHSYFGRDEWEPFAPGLKRIEDATEVRRRMLLAFERAELSEDAAERAALMTFLIVGGGPTGVELAGAIAELARYGMDRDFRRIDPAQARVVLVQSAPRILPTFPEALSAQATQALQQLGVEVVPNSRVTFIDHGGVIVNGERIAARTVLWAAGVVASPAAHWLGTQPDKAGRVQVQADLSVPGHPGIFAIGDTALANAWNGQAVPGLAPAAKQGGEYVASVIAARVRGRSAPAPFAYRHKGSLATIGRKAAVADFGWIRLAGAPAWWLWGAVHVFFLVGVRNRISVIWDWFWSYLTYRSGTRLITHEPQMRVQQPQQQAEQLRTGS